VPPSSSGASSSPSSTCTDLPTPDGYSCPQQKEWGKCSRDYIQSNGYCQLTCGACTSSSPSSGPSSASGSPTVQAYSGPSYKAGRKLLRGRWLG
jgi:hypothetical protein